ncbi:hypothetical protein FPQ18DRAFT_358630 [Pyronema domesticum]|nr:hypothetical protein FPQ18DRAFT_358630 [Pyronema domesticum]
MKFSAVLNVLILLPLALAAPQAKSGHGCYKECVADQMCPQEISARCKCENAIERQCASQCKVTAPKAKMCK